MPRCVVIDGFTAKAVTFDGTNDDVHRTSAFTGVSDGTDGTLSLWFRMNAGDGVLQAFFTMWNSSNSAVFLLQRTSGNTVTILARDSALATKFTKTSTATYTSGATWHHVIASWNATTARFYIDGADVGSITRTSGNIFLSAPKIYIGAQLNSGTPGNRLDGDMAEVFFDDVYYDLSAASDLEKFRTGAGKPANLGGDGSSPSGSPPILYLKGPASTFNVNNGSGGDFTVTGALTDASSSPSD